MITLSTIDVSIIASNLFGGLIALLVAVYVSRREANREAKDGKENWYRITHNTCVRAYGGREVNHRGIKDAKLKEYAQLYRAFSEHIETQLAKAPTDEVDLPLFNSLQNIQLSCIRYANEAETPNPEGLYLQRRHEDIIDYCQISMYIIEHKKSPGVELLHELGDDEIIEAEEKYQGFVDGTLYDEQNRKVNETISQLRDMK